MTTTEHPPTFGVILAGGLSRRMGGGDKPLKVVGDRTILLRVVERLRPQVTGLALNANGDPSRFALFGLPVVADRVGGFAGPLAGILAALDHVAETRQEIAWVASVAADCPFLPGDLVSRLHAARLTAGAPLACAESAGQAHPVIGLWSVALRDDLRRALVVEELRKIDRWTARHGVAAAAWAAEPYDPFFNANTPEDVVLAEAIARDHPEA